VRLPRTKGVGGDLQQQQQSGSAWKVLVTKLDSTKAAKERFGKVEKLVVRGPDELQCPHFGVCAGCSLQGNFTSAPTVLRASQYFMTEDVKMKVHIGDPFAWRTHIKLAVQPLSRWGGLKMGLYKESSHVVEPIPECRVHHPRLNQAAEELRRAATDVGVKGYQEPTLTTPSDGELRYVQMSLERESNKVQLVLVWNVASYKDAEQTLPRLVKRLKGNPALWHSVSVNFHTADSNAIFNYKEGAWKLLWGPPVLREKIGDAFFFFRPQIFRQANLDLFERGIVPLVAQNVPQGSRVSELYAGIGVLGLNAASRSEIVLCSDSNEYVDEVFDRCADSLAEAVREKVFYEPLTADEAVAEGQCDEADVLIVDPPRKGLDEGVLQMLLDKHESAKAENLKRLVYVSCGFDALEKDARALVSSGRWRIKSADGFVLFPGSDHVETVCVFDRVGTSATQEAAPKSTREDSVGNGRGGGRKMSTF
jgi:tRNA/tmRNA/rRNA uracil-C5-methylase (TrmA/RlmC/RlmD family)